MATPLQEVQRRMQDPMSMEELRRRYEEMSAASEPEPWSAEELQRRYEAARPQRGAIPAMAAGIGRGIQDFTEGMMQLWMQATDEEGPATSPAREFTEMINEERAEVDPDQTDPLGRFIGRTLPLMPLAAIPGGGGTLAARLASGTAAGGLAGGAEFAPSGTMAERGFNAAVGATAGAVLPEVARPAARGAAAAARKITGRSGPTPDALARQADFDALGVRPTTGQVTRNPTQLARERNVAQLPGVGDEVAAVRAGQSGQLTRALDDASVGPSMSPTQAGERIQSTLGSRFDDEGIYREMGNRIDELYNQARAAPGADQVLPLSPFARRIGQTMDNFEDAIPGPIKSRIAAFADDRPFTVGEAAKFRQLINQRARNTNDPAQAAGLSALKGHLDDFLEESAGEGIGGDAIELFQNATAASRERARLFDARGLRETVDERVAPDDFVRRFIVGGKRDDLRQMRETLLREGGEQGAAAWETARQQVIDYLRDTSVNDSGSFSAAGYNRALDRIGVDKLRVMFNNDEISHLQRVGRAATNLFTDPPSGGIPVGNRSGTAAANVSNVPGLGWVNRISQSRQANQALAGSATDRIGQGQINQNIANRVVNPWGTNPFAVPGGIMGVLSARALAGGGN